MQGHHGWEIDCSLKGKSIAISECRLLIYGTFVHVDYFAGKLLPVSSVVMEMMHLDGTEQVGEF